MFNRSCGGSEITALDLGGEIKRGAYKTTTGATGAYLVGNIVYNEKGEQIGIWDGQPFN